MLDLLIMITLVRISSAYYFLIYLYINYVYLYYLNINLKVGTIQAILSFLLQSALKFYINNVCDFR